MTVDEIFSLLDNPATLGDALIEAAKLPFRGEHKILFQQKRQKYIAGLTDYERPIWVGEMKNLLSLYVSSGSDNTAGAPNSRHPNEFKTDIFISYARKDMKRVEPIVRELEKHGWSVFWDPEIPPGETWRGYIKKKLDESRCVLVAWSRLSVTSEWVIAEADEAKKRGILVPVLLDAVEPPFGFSHIHAADLTDWQNNAPHPKFSQCVQSIKSRISPSTPAKRVVQPSATPVMLPKAPLDFVHIRGGLFTMGSPASEIDRSDDETQHQVRVSDFYLCKYAVTLAGFKEFIEASGYRTDAEKGDGSYVWDGKSWEKRAGINWRFGISGGVRPQSEENHPVVHVSWNDAVAYCKWISEKTGDAIRLPTEAEWEYACRAGTTTPFHTGDNLTTEQANYDGNYPYNNNAKGSYREATVPVGSSERFLPNQWGLYHMHGNVWEWCGDRYGDKYYDECKAKGVVENPVGPETGSSRVLRGGGWGDDAGGCRSADRNAGAPGNRSDYAGFRLAFVP
jgi:formylglycine-generating enzyme required for sulfatase activity